MANEFKIKKGLIVEGASGGVVVNVLGSQGQLLSVTDDLSGSIFAVSDISGVPIFDVNSSGLSTFTGNVTLSSTAPILYLDNTTATTGKNWRLSSAANGKMYIAQDGVVDAITLDHTSGNATFAGEVSLKSRLNLQRSSAGATTLIQFKNENGVDRAHIDFGGTNEELSFFAGDGATENMTINSSGNAIFNGKVGIGLITPTGNLSMNSQIDNGTNPPGAYTTNTAATRYQSFFNSYYNYATDGLGPYPRFFDMVATGSPDGTNGGSNIRFLTTGVVAATGAVERMRITSAGNSFFNYPNPTIQSYGSGAYGGKVVIKASGAEGLALLNNAIGGSSQVAINFTNEFVANQYNWLARIIAEPEQSWSGTASTRSSRLTFFTNNAGAIGEKMRISSAGAIKFNAYDSTNQTGTPTYMLGTDASGNVVKVLGSGIPGVPGGSGTLNTIPLWTPDGDTLGDSPITINGNNATFAGGITATYGNFSSAVNALYFRTAAANSEYSLLTRDSTGNALFVQNAQSGTDQNIAVFQYGNATVNQGTTVLQVAKDKSYFANCNVGINVTSPQTRLQTNLGITGSYLGYLNGTASTFDMSANVAVVHNSPAIGTGTGAGLVLANNDKSDGAPSPIIAFSAKSASNSYNHAYAAIYGVRTASGADTNWTKGDIVLATGDGTGPKERMRVDNSGNVTIQTSGADDIKNFTINSSNGSSQVAGLIIQNDGANGYINFKLGSGNAAPTTKLTIGNAANFGNVGIGTTLPDVKLALEETPATIASGNAINGSTMKGIKIRTNQNGDESVGLWFGTNGSHWSGISGQRKNSATTWGTTLSFYTHEDTAQDLTYSRERMLISSAGDVGIGTSSPNANLQVERNSSTANLFDFYDIVANIGNLNSNPGNHYPSGIRIYQGSGTMGSGLAALNIGVDTNSAVTASVNTATLETPNGMTGGLRFTTRDTSAPIRFLTDNVERMRILGSGTIQMTDENAGVPLLQARNFATSATGAFNNGYAMEFRGATTTGAGNGMMLLHMNEANDARPTLNVSYSGGIFATFTNGKVGIGTTSPDEKLDITGGFLKFNGGDYGIKGSNSLTYAAYEDHYFSSNGVTKVTIKASGNVGIGTTTPLAKLDIQGTQGQLFSVTDDLSGSIFAVSDISGVPIFDVNSSGVSYFDGKVGIGTNSPDEKLTVNGITRAVDPIYFGAINTDNGTYGPFIESYDDKGLKFDFNGNTGGEFQIWNHDANGGGATEVFTIEDDNNIFMPSSNVTIGKTTSALGALDVDGTFIVSVGTQVRFRVFYTSNYTFVNGGTNGSTIYFGAPTSNVQNIRVQGTATATNFILSSDETLKDNIKNINNNHIDVDWKNFELKSEPGVKRSGVIAQELEKKHPEFVRTDKEGLKSVAYIDLLIAKIAELEARLEKAGL